MRLTVPYIKNLIEEAKKVGANTERLAELEKYVSRQALGNHNGIDECYTFEEDLNSDGSKVTFYSTAPTSRKDRSYFEKLRAAKKVP
jgi:hypothetical protein